MAAEATMMAAFSSVDDSDDDSYHDLFHGDDADDCPSSIRMSRLSIETSDGEIADGELSDKANKEEDEYEEEDESPSAVAGFGTVPGTPATRRRGRRTRGYGSESESRVKGRDGWVEREWERRRRREQGITEDDSECRLLVRTKGRPGCISMDIDEVRACRELGIELQPSDWTVGFSGSAVDTSSGGNSPIANWRISSPGDDPKDVKAKLKMWAHVVALASATRFSS